MPIKCCSVFSLSRLSFNPIIGSGQLVVPRRPGYNIIQNKRPIVDKGKKIIGSTSIILEEKPNDPMPKRQKVEKEQVPQT